MIALGDEGYRKDGKKENEKPPEQLVIRLAVIGY
jgi:hypothetical protein